MLRMLRMLRTLRSWGVPTHSYFVNSEIFQFLTARTF
jgi:hypothetical protein